MNSESKNIVRTGTTILGINCKDGVVMAADRQTTIGHSIVFSKNSQKVEKINDYLVFSGCGSATESQKVRKLLVAELKLKELKSKSRPSVRQAASLLSNIRIMESAFLIAGFNEDGSFELYEVTGGLFSKVEDFSASIGSGMPFALGLLERQYKEGMTVREGIEIATEAMKSSIQRDVGSGYGIDIFTITKDGIKKVTEQTIEPNFKDDSKKK